MNIIIENIQNKSNIENELESLIRKTCIECLKAEKFQYNVEISILITDNEQIKKMNKEYRDIDNATDVLSFPMTGIKDGKFDTPLQPYDFDNGNLLLGDIVISFEKACQQANEYGHSIEREVAFLISHGIFHLLGYDHETPQEEENMISKQNAVLESMGLKRR